MTVTRLPNVPPGKTHLEYVMAEARDRFDEGKWNEGLQNLAHAVWVASVKHEDVSEDVVLKLVREIIGVSFVPEDAA